jgi:hypothetical protein
MTWPGSGSAKFASSRHVRLGEALVKSTSPRIGGQGRHVKGTSTSATRCSCWATGPASISSRARVPVTEGVVTAVLTRSAGEAVGISMAYALAVETLQRHPPQCREVAPDQRLPGSRQRQLCGALRGRAGSRTAVDDGVRRRLAAHIRTHGRYRVKCSSRPRPLSHAPDRITQPPRLCRITFGTTLARGGADPPRRNALCCGLWRPRAPARSIGGAQPVPYLTRALSASSPWQPGGTCPTSPMPIGPGGSLKSWHFCVRTLSADRE